MTLEVAIAPIVKLEELQDKGYWLCKFRRAKTSDTLNTMVSGALRKNELPKVKAAIFLAECQRTRELETGVLLNKWI